MITAPARSMPGFPLNSQPPKKGLRFVNIVHYDGHMQENPNISPRRLVEVTGSLRAAGDLLGVSYNTVRNWTKDDAFPQHWEELIVYKANDGLFPFRIEALQK